MGTVLILTTSPEISKIRRFAALILILVSLALTVARADALTLIRDAEIESTLEKITAPVIRAAGLSPLTVKIYIIQDDSMNAFVAGGQNIFLHTGLLMRLKTVDQLRAVVAHEVGHIAGGHLTRRDSALGGLRGVAAIGMAGSMAAILSGNPEAGMAIAAGTNNVAQRTALAHSRAEEASADQAGLRYLAIAGGDPSAFLEVLDIFRGQNFQRTLGLDPYAQTHPLSTERLALMKERIEQLPKGKPLDPQLAYWHGRMVVKLKGFLQTPRRTLDQYPDNGEETNLLARAVAWHRFPNVEQTRTTLEALLEIQPNDPYYNEMKGQFLLETGQATAAAEAYHVALDFAPREPLVLAGLGRALLNQNTPEATREAREVLAQSVRYDRANAGALRDLAMAEGRLGNDGAAALATAERFLLAGKYPDAIRNAARASDLLPMGSPGWRRAEDLMDMLRRRPARNR